MSTYADAIRRQAEDAPRAALPAVTAALWRAYGEGHITEAEAEALSVLIEARRLTYDGHVRGRAEQGPNPTRTGIPASANAPQDRQNSPRTGVGSRPRSDASLERRRRWAASGRLPPALAARFSLAELAVLSLVAAETVKRGDCRLSVGHLAAMAGVAERTAQNAIREARQLGLLTVEERRLTGFRNDTNVVRIISPEWTAWLRLARKPISHHHDGDTFRPHGASRHGPTFQGGGCKSLHPTSTQISNQGKTRTRERSRTRSAGLKSPLQAMSRKAGA